MASVDHLLVALHERTGELTAYEKPSYEDALLGWHRLARNARCVLVMIDAPTELMPILQAILDEVEVRDANVDTPISALGYTLGALADTLNSHPDAVAIAGHADRTQLRACVLTSLHHAAIASLSAATPRTPPSTLLRELADTTQAACYVPWRPLHPPLSRIALGPTCTGLDQAVARWAEAATGVLNSRAGVTGYAFQRTATSIARICHSAAAVFSPFGEHTVANWEEPTALTSASRFWQIAAAWPPEIRLGGRTTGLRLPSQELDLALDHSAGTTDNRPVRQRDMHSALLQAEEVAAIHEGALTRLVSNRGLWVIADALGQAYLTRHPGVRRSGWVTDPGTAYGAELIHAVRTAAKALRGSIEGIDQLQRADYPSPAPSRSTWEQVVAGRRPPPDQQLLPPPRGRTLDR